MVKPKQYNLQVFLMFSSVMFSHRNTTGHFNVSIPESDNINCQHSRHGLSLSKITAICTKKQEKAPKSRNRTQEASQRRNPDPTKIPRGLS